MIEIKINITFKKLYIIIFLYILISCNLLLAHKCILQSYLQIRACSTTVKDAKLYKPIILVM